MGLFGGSSSSGDDSFFPSMAGTDDSFFPSTGYTGDSSGSGSGSWLSGIGDWYNQNKSGIQSVLKDAGSMTGSTGTGTTSAGGGSSGMTSQQASAHQGSASSIGDLFSALLQKRLASANLAGRSSTGLLG